MESHLPDTEETDRAISLTAGSTQSNGKLAGTSGAPVEPTTGSLASSDRSFDAEGDAQNPPSTASNKRSFTMWEIYLQRQSNMVIPLIRIPGIMKSPQPIETLIQLITDLHKKDVAGVPNGHSSKLELFDDLATNLDSLSKINPKLSLIDYRVASRTQAVLLTPDNDPLKLKRLMTLGESLGERNRPSDLDCAIKCFVQALELPQSSIISRVQLFIRLAVAFGVRFDKSKELHDVNMAIQHLEQALALAGDADENKPLRLFKLGKRYHNRFHCSGKPKDLDKAIECHRRAVDGLPDNPDDSVEYLDGLSDSFSCRFKQLGDVSDLEQAIECLIVVDSIIPEGHSNKRNFLRTLGNHFKRRFDLRHELADIDKAVERYIQALHLTAQGSPDIVELLADLGLAHHSRFKLSGILDDLDKAIEYHTQAVRLTPAMDSMRHTWLTNLGNSYRSRFIHQGVVADIDKAVEYQNQAVEAAAEGHVERPRWLNNLGNSYDARFDHLGEQSDLNKAIERKAQAVALIAEEHLEKPRLLTNLGNSHIRRFNSLGKLADIDKAIEYQNQAVLLTPEGHGERAVRLQALGHSHMARFKNTGNINDIANAVEYATRAVTLTPEGRPELPSHLNILGDVHICRYHSFREIHDVDVAIEFHTKALLFTPHQHIAMSDRLIDLGMARQIRFIHLRSPVDIQSAIQCLEKAAHISFGPPSTRFRAAKIWAQILSSFTDDSPLPAYGVAMQLVSKVIWLGATVHRRYKTVSSSVGDIAVEAAAAAISAKEYALAVEWLEEGRSIVWNQNQQLRSPLDELSAVNPTLAQTLKQVALSLEAASVQASNKISIGNDDKMLEAAAQNHRRLAEQYEDLLSKARALPGLHSFLRPTRAADLLHVARSGPVVIVNVGTTRCDALVLLPRDTSITHIPLPHLSHSEVKGLRDQMEASLISSGIRERGFTTSSGNRRRDHFENVLASLWHKVAKPVLDYLGCIENQPSHELPHITWCTTGDLSFLPIHAAGLYDRPHANVFDLSVSSYTPTLGALLISYSRRSTTSASLLAVGQEETAGCAPLPGTKAEIASILRHAKDVPCKELQGDQATVKATLDAMDQSTCVHLACHASQNLADPTQSGFHLHDGALSLAAIAGKSFKNKELAFLSACQTAAGDKQLPNEAIHLAAGMLVAGYPSVIATMWSIHDSDAPLIADQVYAQLIRDGTIDSTGAAKALHAAMGALRTKVGDKAFTRWVPYIHMGV